MPTIFYTQHSWLCVDGIGLFGFPGLCGAYAEFPC